MALVTWMVKEFQGIRVMQRNVKAFLSHEDTCVDIHLSKVNFRASDEQLFDAVLQSIQIKEQPVRHQAPNPGAAPDGQGHRRGFTFVGPTICYAFMQAVGMVNDH